jgi:hypothetical protein
MKEVGGEGWALAQQGAVAEAYLAGDRVDRRALALAHGAQAKSLELRAAMSLSRLLRQRDKAEEGRRLLTEIHG